MNTFDRAQALELAEHEAIQQRARLPDAMPVTARDCCDCGDPIPPERLQAYPHATACVSCAMVQEIRARAGR